MTWAWEQNIPMSAKMVLLALSDRANDDGQCWPGHDSMAKKCSMHRSTVLVQIKKLVSLGLISSSHRYDQMGHRTSNIYHLHLDAKVVNPNVVDNYVGNHYVVTDDAYVGISPSLSRNWPAPKSESPTVNIRETSEKRQKKHQSTAPATRLPNDWTPSPVEIEFCRKNRPDLNPDEVADEFRDYWISVPGAKGKKLDWTATWRNWVRKQRSHAIVTGRESAKDRSRREAYEVLTGRKQNHEQQFTGNTIESTAVELDRTTF